MMNPKPQRVYRGTVVVWLIAVAVHLFWFAFMRSQIQTDEVYAQAFLFQIAAFFFTNFIYWIVGLLIVLVIEFIALRVKPSL